MNNKLKVGLDISPLAWPQLSGISYQLLELLRSLSRIQSGFDLKLFCISHRGIKFREELQRMGTISHLRLPHRIAAKMPLFLFFKNISVLYWTSTFLPYLYLSKTPIIYNVYDLISLKFPQFYPSGYGRKKEKVLRSVLNLVDIIVVSSECTRKDLVNLFEVSAKKEKVVPYGVNREKFHPNHRKEEINRVLKKYSIPQPYILFTGFIQPRKNIKTLLKVYYQLIKKYDIPHFLVLAGGIGYKGEEELKEIFTLKLQDRIRTIGYISDRDLPLIYNGADVYFFPSYYEGFGLTILEAMASGVPVISSNTSSLPEVGGGAAIQIDPDNVEGFLEVMVKVLFNNVLKEEMKRNGLQQVRNFSWERAAQKISEIFLELTNKKS